MIALLLDTYLPIPVWRIVERTRVSLQRAHFGSRVFGRISGLGLAALRPGWRLVFWSTLPHASPPPRGQMETRETPHPRSAGMAFCCGSPTKII